MSDSVDPVEVLQAILNTIVSDTDSKEELVKLWFYVGRMMGIERVFPEMQVVITPDENDKRQPIVLVGSVHPTVIDYLTDERIFSEKLADLCLDEIKKMDIVH